MGRVTKWEYLDIESRLPEIELWLKEDGCTDKDVAGRLGVSPVTLNKWKKEQPSFLEVLKRGKSVADQRVINALHQRACGYSHPEERIFCNADGEVTRVQTIKHYPPDTAAAIIWLTNRQNWKNRYDHQHAGEINNPAVDRLADKLTELSIEKLEEIANGNGAKITQ